ncbi:MAG: shikimate kinase [Epsilonproteobacteria bacterium]|jgi:shikimate kinase|nr:shikimate kinase [Campylobacterota bacterium]NPA88886.1 shikimate kinase [Campylobacterota bacterium]
MGSGKSTIGRLLARKLHTYFLDSDKLIENFENRTIPQIFEEEGESKFRQLEMECFNWIKTSVKGTVISVGGGFPIYIPQIREAGEVFYLYTPFETIVQRLDSRELAHRPLFRDLMEARKLYQQREGIYRQLADHIIYNENLEETLQRILEIVEKGA